MARQHLLLHVEVFIAIHFFPPSLRFDRCRSTCFVVPTKDKNNNAFFSFSSALVTQKLHSNSWSNNTIMMMNRLLSTSSRMGGMAIRSSMYRMMSSTSTRRPVVLCILDGWGYSETLSNNAVTLANTPNFDYLYGRCSQLGQAAFLNACEKDVGLPTGQIGNSEVGHMNIGAGRVVYQVRHFYVVICFLLFY